MANNKKKLKRFNLPREQRRILNYARSICGELRDKYDLIDGQRCDAIICATNHVIHGVKEIIGVIEKSPEIKAMEKIAEIDIWDDGN